MVLGEFWLKRSLWILGVLVSTSGCGFDTPQHLPLSSLNVGGVDRGYYLFVPNTLPETPVPLVIAAHGGGMADSAFPQQDRFEALAETEGFILVFPRGEEGRSGAEGEWHLNTDAQTREDMDFMEALMDELASQYPIDTTRVYGTGYSLGSMLNYEFACHLSSRFAAVASYAGTMPVSPKTCDQVRPVPIMHIHGREDGTIPYNDTWDWKNWDTVGSMRAIPSLVQFWLEKYNCQEHTDEGFSDSTHFVYMACDDNVRVEHHRLEGVGHAWPDTVNGVSTHQVIWSFLSQFSSP